MLGYTDEQTWKLTPRQFSVQISVHEDVTKRMYGDSSSSSPSSKEKATSDVGFIDQIPGW